MTSSPSYDIVVIGSGQSGDPLARAFANAGQSVALIEREHVGGTCANTGCTPTKTMIASARVAYLASRAADFGIHFEGPVTTDLVKVRERKRAIVADFTGSSRKQIEETKGLDLIDGEAHFTGPQSVTVTLKDGTSREISGQKFFLNTGLHDVIPPVPGLDSVPALSHATIEELDTLPAHLVVLGGGYIALEFGQMFRRFGSQVTIIEKSPHLMMHEDEDVCEAMENILRQDGLTLLTGSQVQNVSPDGDGVQLAVETSEGTQTVRGSHLLIATGRAPNTEKLGLDKAGVAVDDKGHILTNNRLETNVPGIWALGDVKGGPAFTHISYDDYRIIKANLLEGSSRTVDDRPTPYTVFTDPELGRVGLTETQARDKGLKIRVAKIDNTEVARALETDETRGFLKAIVDADSGQILGCAMISVDGGETMSVVQTAMMGKLPYTALRDGVFAHPTFSESLNNLFMTLD